MTAEPLTPTSWVDFWEGHAERSRDRDPQSQVMRTFAGAPIDAARWQLTLDELDRVFPVGPDDDVLDLCCGNGLLTRHLARTARSVLAVDAAAPLLEGLRESAIPGVRTQVADARALRCEPGQFSRILVYAGLQYFTHAETVTLVESFARWLRPGGVLLCGDVPDSGRLFDFYNTPERRTLYFENVRTGRDVVGTWFDGPWLEALARDRGFADAEVLPQHEGLIYAHFRYDLRATR